MSSSPHAIFFSGPTPQQWEGFCGIATFSLEVHLHTPIYAVPLRGKCTLLSPPPPPSSSKRHQKNSFPGNFLPPPLPSVPGAQNRSTLVKRRGKRGHKTQQFFPSCHGSVDRGGGRPEGRSKRCASSIPAKRPGRRQAGLPPPPLTIGIATHFARQLFVSVFLRGRSVPSPPFFARLCITRCGRSRIRQGSLRRNALLEMSFGESRLTSGAD